MSDNEWNAMAPQAAQDIEANWDDVFRKITDEADRDIWRKQGLRLTWREVNLLASVLRSIDGLPFAASLREPPRELSPSTDYHQGYFDGTQAAHRLLGVALSGEPCSSCTELRDKNDALRDELRESVHVEAQAASSTEQADR